MAVAAGSCPDRRAITTRRTRGRPSPRGPTARAPRHPEAMDHRHRLGDRRRIRVEQLRRRRRRTSEHRRVVGTLAGEHVPRSLEQQGEVEARPRRSCHRASGPATADRPMPPHRRAATAQWHAAERPSFHRLSEDRWVLVQAGAVRGHACTLRAERAPRTPGFASPFVPPVATKPGADIPPCEADDDIDLRGETGTALSGR